MTRAREVATDGGLVLINSTTFTAQSTVSFNNVFSSTYNNYKLLISATGSVVSANGNLRMRVGGVDNSSSNYARQFLRAIGGSVSGNFNTLTETNLVDVGTGFTSVATVEIFSPALAVNTRIQAHFNGVNTDTNYIGLFEAQHKVATAYDGFSFIPSAGTTTGTISIYGYKN